MGESMTEADLQQLQNFQRRVDEEALESKARSQRAWAGAKRIMLIALLAACLAAYYLLSRLHSALLA